LVSMDVIRSSFRILLSDYFRCIMEVEPQSAYMLCPSVGDETASAEAGDWARFVSRGNVGTFLLGKGLAAGKSFF
jgi:hypothetical protein